MNSFLRLQFEIVVKNAAALTGVQNQIKQVGSTTSKAGSQVQSGFINKIRDWQNGIIGFGKQIQWTGRQLEYNFTLPILHAGEAIYQLGIKNEQALTRLVKVYGSGSDAIGELDTKMLLFGEHLKQLDTNAMTPVEKEGYNLGRVFRHLSDLYGQSIDGVSQLGASWAATGKQGAALAKYVKLTMDAMVVGDFTDQNEAFETLVQIQSSYGLSAAQTEAALAVLNTTENITAAQFGDLAKVVARAGGAARTAGVDIQHLAATAAILVPATGSAESAGNSLKTLFSKLIAPTENAIEVLNLMGVSFDENAFQAMNASERLEFLASKFEPLTQAQKGVVSAFVAGRYQLNRFEVVMAGLADQNSDYFKVLRATSGALDENSEVMKTYRKEIALFLTSTPQGIKIAQTQIKNMAISIGAQLAPAVLGALHLVVGLVNEFSKLDPHVQTMVLLGIVAIAAVGPIARLTGAFVQLIGVVGKAATFLVELPLSIARGFIGFAGFFWTLAADIAKPFLKLAGVIGQAFSFIASVAMQAMGGLIGAVAKAGPVVAQSFLKPLATAISGMASIFAQVGATLFGPLVASILQPLQWLAVQIDIVLTKAFTSAMAGARTFFEPLIGAAVNAMGAVRTVIFDFITKAMFTAGVVLNNFGGIMQKAFAPIGQVVSSAFSAIPRVATTAMEGASRAIMVGFEAIFGVIGALPTVLGGAFATVKFYVVGAFQAIGPAVTRVLTVVSQAVMVVFEAIFGVIGNLGPSIMAGLTWVSRAVMAVFEAVFGVIGAIPTIVQSAFASVKFVVVGAMQSIGAALTAALTWVSTATMQALDAIVGFVGAIPGYIAQFFAWIAKLPAIVAEAVTIAFGAVQTFMAATWTFLTGIVSRIPTVMLAAQEAIVVIATTVGSALAAGFSALWAGIVALPELIAGLVPLIATVAQAIWAALTGPVGLVILAIISLIAAWYAYRDKVNGVIADVGHWFADVFSGIGHFFQSLFGKLPEGVQKAFLSVVQIVADAMKAVIHWLSYLNPFARHSPSLVDNVTAGVAVIAAKYASLSQIGSISAAATQHMKEFAAATADAQAASLAAKRGEQTASVTAVAPSAGPQLQTLFGDQDQLQAAMGAVQAEMVRQQATVDQLQAAYDDLDRQVDAANAVLQAQKDIADNLKSSLDAANDRLRSFADAPIAGMKAMNDAIWSNDLAQKQLQLQMMKLEDTMGPIDEVQNRMAALAGDIEKLQGMQSDLRRAGAGSEITGPIQDQIDALEAQRVAVTDQAKPLQDMQDQLAALQRQGQELNLEKSVQFDPLTKQIEDATTAMKELPFDEIMAGISSSKAEVDRLSASYEQANAAVTTQQAVVDQLTAARDAAKVPLDAEKAKLDSLNDAYQTLKGQYDDITSAINDFVSASTDAAQAQADLAGASTAAADLFSTAGDFEPGDMPAIPEMGGDLDQMQADLQTQMDTMMKGLSPKKMLLDMWHQIEGFWDSEIFPRVKPLWDKFAGWMESGWNAASGAIAGATKKSGIQGSLSGVTDSVGNMGDKIEGVFKKLSDNGLITWFFDRLAQHGKTVVDAASLIIEYIVKLGETIGKHFSQWEPLIKPAMEAIGRLVGIVVGAAMLIIGGFLAIEDYLYNILKPVFQTVFDFIVETVGAVIDFFRGFFEIIIGLINGDWAMAWQGVKDMFAAVWDYVVAFLRLAVKLIWDLLKIIGEVAWDTVNFFWDAFKWMIARFFDVVGAVGEGIASIIDFFISLPGKILSKIIDFMTSLIDWLNPFASHSPSLVDMVRTGIDAIVEFFLSLPGRAVEALLNFGQFIWDSIVGGIKWVLDDGVKYYLELLRLEWVVLPQKIWDALGDLGRWLWDHLKDGMEWLGIKELEIVDKVVGFFVELPGRVWSGIGDLGRWLWDKLKQGMEWLGTKELEIVDKVVGFFTGLPGRIWVGMGDIGTWIWNQVSGGFYGLKNAISGIVDDVFGFFRDLPGRIGGFATDLYNAAKNLGTQIYNGISAAFGALGDLAKDLGNSLIAFLNNNLISKLEGGINWAIDKFNSIPVIPDLDHITLPTIPYIGHSGGVVPGTLGQEVPAILQAGEVVIDLATVRALKQAGLFGPNGPALPGGRADLAPANRGEGAKIITFTGDLSFPNVRDGSDANEFIRNLEALAGQ